MKPLDPSDKPPTGGFLLELICQPEPPEPAANAVAL